MAEQEQRAALVMLLRAHGIRDLRVLNAFERMPRQQFIAKEFNEAALRDSPLPLPCGQTMERPSDAAQLIEIMQVESAHRVLEIGAGSGWLTCVLAQLAKEVVAYERYGELVKRAHNNLKKLGIHNVRLVQGDGLQVNDNTHYDRIVLHGSLETMPEELTLQLAGGGRLYAAIGPANAVQQLTCFTKAPEGVVREQLYAVNCAPLAHGQAHML
jgi:protein-L-isoaspartate(D-aspartate) O-methyltransferase